MLVDISVYLVEGGAPITDYTFAYLGVGLNEALWAYLAPWLMRLKLATGAEIDLYNVSDFYGEKLEILKQHIEQALAHLQKEEVTVHVVDLSEEIGPDGIRTVLYDLQRDVACDCLRDILKLIAEATAQKKAFASKAFKGENSISLRS
jgi:hypothetical protein